METNAKFLLNKFIAIEKYKELEKISDIVSYSYKTNHDVGHILKDNTRCFFSVHSIKSVKQIDDPKRIWYFAQAISTKKINELFKLEIRNFVVDNENDLNNLILYLQSNNKKINLLLRMRLKEHTIHTGKHFVYGFYSKKVNELIEKLSSQEHIGKIGVHFHRKTQNVSEWSLVDELDSSIKKENWKKISYVNIGGGLPATYKNYDTNIIMSVLIKINKIKKWLQSKEVEMIIEPGRFIAAPSVKLETSIVNMYDNNIVVDCSIFNAAMDTWLANIRLKIENELDKGKAYTIKGCTPDSADIFRYKAFLFHPKIGDKIIFLNAGAYNFNCDFCNLPKLKTEVVD